MHQCAYTRRVSKDNLVGVTARDIRDLTIHPVAPVLFYCITQSAHREFKTYIIRILVVDGHYYGDPNHVDDDSYHCDQLSWHYY